MTTSMTSPPQRSAGGVKVINVADDDAVVAILI